MNTTAGLDDLVAYLEETTRLSRSEARRVIEEVLAYFAESPEQFIRRRHAQLQADEEKNDAIFDQIAAELKGRRFSVPELSQRQIRRLIYG